jgi:hypothetical protein
MLPEKKPLNPYIEHIFGKWFKNLVLVILLIPTVGLLFWGFLNNFIDREFGLQLLFLLLGIYIGKWLDYEK